MEISVNASENGKVDISYGIYTVERLPKGSKRTPKWDLHSMAQDRETAEIHAKTLSAQPYFDHVEVKEFRTDPATRERMVRQIRSYSRVNPARWIYTIGIVTMILLFIFQNLG